MVGEAELLGGAGDVPVVAVEGFGDDASLGVGAEGGQGAVSAGGGIAVEGRRRRR
jgi:hypothetical protein